MNPSSGLDRQAFEAFLANASAVQKSGLDAQSLSAIVEVQRFIAASEPNLDRALDLISDRSLKVAQASGVAIARLESNQLIYCAAKGSAVNEIGRRLPAVFSLCAQGEGKAEILRVEDAQTDSRIQAEICRQFGAASLLILPICHHHVIKGILQVHFSEPHSFLDREVRAYRLMAGMAADVLSGTLEHTKKEAPVALPQTADLIHQFTSQRQALTGMNKPSSLSVQIQSHPADLIFKVEEFARIAIASAKQWAQVATQFFAKNDWEWQMISAAVVLAIVLGFAHFHHPAPTTLDSTISAPSTPEKLPDIPISVSDHWKSFDRGPRDEMAPNAAFRKVRIGPNEVDYIAKDVTIRHFANSQARPQRNVKLVNIGDDVTVRYFSSESEVASQATPLSTTPTTK
jgi:hypothetical protein